VGERGYLRRVAPVGNAGLERPVYDTAGGIVLSPRPGGIQISTGTELCLPGAPKRARQAREALERARLLLPLGEQIGPLESAERPTLPDTLPAIGPLAGAPGVWLATGHQHIGFSTSAGTGELIAEGIAGAALPGWAAPFAPARFGL
jgi:D-amino-acid dehydrogenase